MTIIVLWILLAIIALIVILLHFSVSAYIKYDENGFLLKAKYLFLTLYPRKPKKPKKIKVKKEKKAVTTNTDDVFSDSLDDELEEYKEELSYENLIENSAEESVDEAVLEEQTDISENEQPEKPPSKVDKKSDKKEKKKAKKESKPKEKKEGKLASIKEKYYKYRPYFPMGWKYFKKLLKSIRITDVRLNVDVGREDAHEAAIYYGAIQGLLFSNLGLLCNVFTVKIKRVNVNCIFTKNTIDGSAECYVRVRPSTIIAIAFCIGVKFLVIWLRQRRLNKKKQNNENQNENQNISMEVVENE